MIYLQYISISICTRTFVHGHTHTHIFAYNNSYKEFSLSVHSVLIAIDAALVFEAFLPFEFYFFSQCIAFAAVHIEVSFFSSSCAWGNQQFHRGL